MIIFVTGLPGSGKSYFASRLAKMLDAVYLNSDLIRKELLRDIRYTDSEKCMVYNEMLQRAIASARENSDVVLDETFYTESFRQTFIETLQPITELAFIEVTATEELIRERLRKPRIDSDANFEVYRELKEEWEPILGDHLVLRSSDCNIENMLDQTMGYLKKNCL